MERRLQDLEARLRALEARFEALETATRHPASPQPGSPLAAEGPVAAAMAEAAIGARPPSLPGLSVGSGLGLLGRSFLVLGGAFLLRTVTDADVVPQTAGIALGLAYALVWILLAGRRQDPAARISDAFHAVTAAAIAFPLLAEATVGFGVLGPVTAPLALAGVTAIGLAVSWHRRLRSLAWTFTIAACSTAFLLMLRTRVHPPYAAFLVATGVATVALAYGRDWRGPRWFAAVVADLAVVAMVLVVPGAGHRGILPDPVLDPQGVALALLLGYTAVFAARTLARRGTVHEFEWIQSGAALLVGLGGSVRIADLSHGGHAGLGIAALVAGIGTYAVAFAFVRRRDGRSGNFFFYSSIAIVLVVVGGRLAAAGPVIAPAWGALALLGAVLGGRWNRVTLRAHAAVYAAAAAWSSGLLTHALTAFAGATERAPVFLSPAELAILACVVGGWWALVATRRYRGVPRLARVPRFAILLIALAGLATVAVASVAAPLARGATPPDPGAVALARTAVLSLAAILLAWARRRSGLAELAWPVYPVLAAIAVKLLLQDVRLGEPATLFPGFAVYGLALILVPRLLGTGRKAHPADGPAAPA